MRSRPFRFLKSISQSIRTISGSTTEEEDRLVKELFSRYNRLIRPVKFMNETVEVSLKFILTTIISVVSGEAFHPI